MTKEPASAGGGRIGFFGPAAWVICGFIAGAGLMLFLLYPSQRLLVEREKALTEMANFNRQEQERVRQMRDISSGEMVRYLGLIEQTNAEFQRIQQRLNDQEKSLQNPGWFYIVVVLIFILFLAGMYFLANRNANLKDVATLETFEQFIRARLQGIEERKLLTEKVRPEKVDVSRRIGQGEGAG